MRTHLCIGLLFFAAACGGNSSSPFGAPDQASPDGVDSKEDGLSSARTDKRVPELGGDPTIALDSKVSMADGLKLAAASYGPTIEAKFELDDAGKLSLSIYPVGKGIATDA